MTIRQRSRRAKTKPKPKTRKPIDAAARRRLDRRAHSEKVRRALGLFYPKGSKEFLIAQHWYWMKETLSFGPDRILRLCEAMQVTPRELALMVRQSPGMADRWISGTKVNPSIELHFLMFERAALGLVSPGAERPLFPEGVIGHKEEAGTDD